MQARALADTSGVELEKPATFTKATSKGSSPIVYAESVVADDGLRTSTLIEASELTVAVNVTLVYEIE